MQHLLHNLLTNTPITASLTVPLAIVTILLLATIISFISVRAANLIIKRYLMRLTRHFVKTSLVNMIDQLKIIDKCTRLIPGYIFYIASSMLVFKEYAWTTTLSHTAMIFSILFLLLGTLKLIFSLLDLFVSWYHQLPIANGQPITSYIQFIKIILAALTGILVISLLVDKSPLALLTGLGALSAVLLLVFKDTITGFVSSIQVSANDLVRVGDWITIPHLHVDGDVYEISINTVKVRNFDKTIITIPTNSLIQSGVQNWRGMKESGGRRIKRAINIDITSIKFCDEMLLSKIKKIELLKEKLATRQRDIIKSNEEYIHKEEHALNRRQLTNIGLFRYYIECYLQSQPTINFSHTFLVRQLEPTPVGLPLQLYIFTKTTDWVRYEEIQADIFDHLLAAIAMFELKVFQYDTAPNTTTNET